MRGVVVALGLPLAGLGCHRLDFILCRGAESFEALLGQGERWGLELGFHLARDPRRPYARLAAALAGAGEVVWLAAANRLPGLPGADDPAPGLVLGPDGAWTGWGLLERYRLARADAGADETGLAAWLRAGGAALQSAAGLLDGRDPAGLLAAHQSVLAGAFPGLLRTGRQVEPGVWIARNVSLHPTARITPPVYLAADSQVEAGAELGPDLVLGRGSLLDRGVSARRSLILPGSYVGRDLELDQVIVDQGRLISTRLGVSLAVAEGFVLGSLADRQLRRSLARLASRVAAHLGLALAVPLILLTLAFLDLSRRDRPLLRRRDMVRLPLAEDPATWREYRLTSLAPQAPGREGPSLTDLALRVLPGLAAVAREDLSLVGLEPLTRDELDTLPRPRLGPHRRGKAGLISEADLVCGPGAGGEEVYLAEACYVARAGPAHDLRLLLRYLGQALCPRRRAHPTHGPGRP